MQTMENKTIGQDESFNDLGTQFSSCQNGINEAKGQANKGNRISGALRDIIWNNTNMNKRSKVQIYQT